MKIVYYVAQSLDGYIADSKHSVKWLENYPTGEPNDYDQFISSVDAVLMGRKTFDFILKYGSNPYPNHPVFVLSSQSISHPLTGISVIHDLDEFLTRDYKRVWCVGGGKLASSLLQKNRLDELMITTIPMVLGAGIPLFGELPDMTKVWKLESVNSTTGGCIQARYSINS